MSARIIAAAAVLFAAAPGWAQTDAGPADAGVAAGGADAGGAIVLPDDVVPPPDAPEARAAISSTTVQVGRPFSLFVTITAPAGVEVNVPTALPLGGAFEELRRTYSDDRLADGRVARRYEIELMAWLVGDLAIPPIKVVYVARGAALETATNPVPVTVVGVIGEGEEKLRDIAPPLEVDRPNYKVIALIGIGAAVLVGLVVFWLLARAARRRRRRPSRRKAKAAPELPLAPDARALARLEALEASGALESDDRKPAYLEMSEIVRDYLGARFSFAALDRNSSEVKEHLRSRPDGEPALAILDDWLAEVDLVKYAGYQASSAEAEQVLARARELVAVCERTPVRTERPPTPAPAPPPPFAPAPAPESGPAEPTAGDTLRGIPASGPTRSRWAPPPEKVAQIVGARDTVKDEPPVVDDEPATLPEVASDDDDPAKGEGDA